MSLVKCQEDMDDLCWGVLRRYAVAGNRFPSPPRNVRQAAWSAIKQAQRKATLPKGLFSPPDGFWIKPLPGGRTFWFTTELVRVPIGSKGFKLQMCRALDELLDPLHCPSEITDSAILSEQASCTVS